MEAPKPPPEYYRLRREVKKKQNEVRGLRKRWWANRKEFEGMVEKTESAARQAAAEEAGEGEEEAGVFGLTLSMTGKLSAGGADAATAMLKIDDPRQAGRRTDARLPTAWQPWLARRDAPGTARRAAARVAPNFQHWGRPDEPRGAAGGANSPRRKATGASVAAGLAGAFRGGSLDGLFDAGSLGAVGLGAAGLGASGLGTSRGRGSPGGPGQGRAGPAAEARLRFEGLKKALSRGRSEEPRRSVEVGGLLAESVQALRPP
ncbi:unnamed protein product [Prorocentrum cordatum]|uniref:Uncharacterized protein n=1 Tax=Prorocentrum cordatum TaxID=2364126 RepID=A0ABN9RQS8_9DINO|nr:unnamed protein product [Polarella glacialis]